jgi:hypothetical protein
VPLIAVIVPGIYYVQMEKKSNAGTALTLRKQDENNHQMCAVSYIGGWES